MHPHTRPATSSSNSVYNICHNKNSKHGIHMKIWKIKRIPRLPSSFVCTTSTNIHITICPYPTTILNHQVPSKQTTAGIYVRGVVQRSSIVCSTTFFTFRVLLLVSTTTFIATYGYYMDSIHDWRWYILVILRSLLKGWGYICVCYE